MKRQKRLPRIVSEAEWQIARDKLLRKEKTHTRARDALAAERRRLPMVKIDKSYGVEALRSPWTFLDLTPFGRQETWEDSPAGWPQTPPYRWWRRHDEYGA